MYNLKTNLISCIQYNFLNKNTSCTVLVLNLEYLASCITVNRLVFTVWGSLNPSGNQQNAIMLHSDVAFLLNPEHHFKDQLNESIDKAVKQFHPPAVRASFAASCTESIDLSVTTITTALGMPIRPPLVEETAVCTANRRAAPAETEEECPHVCSVAYIWTVRLYCTCCVFAAYLPSLGLLSVLLCKVSKSLRRLSSVCSSLHVTGTADFSPYTITATCVSLRPATHISTTLEVNIQKKKKQSYGDLPIFVLFMKVLTNVFKSSNWLSEEALSKNSTSMGFEHGTDQSHTDRRTKKASVFTP